MRALMLDPPLLLFDEPLGALDPITRSELQAQLKEIFARLNKTVVLVTHDMGEAAYFGDTIVLMRAGKIVQMGTLDDLLQRPSEPYVTDFHPRPALAPAPDAGGESMKGTPTPRALRAFGKGRGLRKRQEVFAVLSGFRLAGLAAKPPRRAFQCPGGGGGISSPFP